MSLDSDDVGQLRFDLEADDEDDGPDDDWELELGPLDVDDPLSDALNDVGADDSTDVGTVIERTPPVDDTDDLELDFDEQENETAVDELSAAAESAFLASNEDVAGADDIRAHSLDRAIKMEPGGGTPVEVVKPFDLAPSPDQVPAKNFKPRIPRSGGMISSLLKFAIGGLLGLLLCQGGLWWIGHLDPLGLAAKLPPAIGFLAPESVRIPHRSMVANRPPSLDFDPTPIEQLPEPAGSQDVGVPVVPGNSEAPGDNETPGDDENRASAFPTTVDLGTPPEPIDITNDVVAVDTPKNGIGAPDIVLPLANDDSSTLFGSDDGLFDSGPPPAAPMVGLVGKQQLDPSDLNAAIGESNRTFGNLLAAVAARESREAKQARMFEFYDATLKMAETAIHVDDSAAPVIDQMQSFVQGISKYGKVLGQTAARQLPNSLQRGVFLSCTVTGQSLLDAGYQRIQVTLLGDRPDNYQLIAPSSIMVNVGDRVFVLGVLVANPTLEISGLSSAIDGQAVWSDQIIPMQ